MGCSASTILTTACATGHPLPSSNSSTKPACESVSAFTDTQKTTVLRQWRILSNDLSGRGARIFLRIFDRNPHVQRIFHFSDLAQEDLVRDPTFKGHASRFMQAVGAVIDNIDDYEKALSPLLNGLGRQHIHYVGFRYDYFDAFEESMVHVWAEDLGGKFDGAANEAWTRVFRFIMSELKAGYQAALQDSGLDRPPWEVTSQAGEVTSQAGDAAPEVMTSETPPDGSGTRREGED